jgi:hypothetical protein
MAMPEEYTDPPRRAKLQIWGFEHTRDGRLTVVPYLVFSDVPPLRGTLNEDGVYYGEEYFGELPSGSNLYKKYDISAGPLPVVVVDQESRLPHLVYSIPELDEVNLKPKTYEDVK